MRLVASALVLLSLFATAQAFAQPAAAPWTSSSVKDWSTPPKPGLEKNFQAPEAKSLRLANGMRVLVIENHALPLVSIAVMVVGAGSAADPVDKFGVADFAADMLDEGAKDLSALDIASLKERLGASISVSANIDYAMVRVSTLRKTLKPTIQLLAAILGEPSFNADEAKRLRGDLITHLRLKPDRPRELAGELLDAAIFGGKSAYGHPITGTLKDAQTVTLADAKAFYQAHWVPTRMTLVVAGDVTVAQIRDLLGPTLAAWKPKGRPAKRPRVRQNKKSAQILLVDRPGAPQSDLRIGLWGLRRNDARYAKMAVLSNLLGGSFTSRLNNRLREQLGYTYGIRATSYEQKFAGSFVISTALHTPKTIDGIQEILRIVKELREQLVSKEELDKAKFNIIRDLPAQFESNGGITAAYAHLALHGLPLDWYGRYAKALRAVSAKDIQRLASSFLRPKKFFFVLVGDQKKLALGLDQLKLGKRQTFDNDGQPKAPSH